MSQHEIVALTESDIGGKSDADIDELLCFNVEVDHLSSIFN